MNSGESGEGFHVSSDRVTVHCVCWFTVCALGRVTEGSPAGLAATGGGRMVANYDAERRESSTKGGQAQIESTVA